MTDFSAGLAQGQFSSFDVMIYFVRLSYWLGLEKLSDGVIWLIGINSLFLTGFGPCGYCGRAFSPSF